MNRVPVARQFRRPFAGLRKLAQSRPVRISAVAILFVALAACDDRARIPEVPSQTPPARDFLMSWTVSHPHWGTEALLLRRDGTLRLLLTRPGSPETARETRLTDDELRALDMRLQEAHPCDLAASTRPGKPNESRPTLTLNFASMACSKTQWFDEWRTSDRARPVAEIVAALRAKAASGR